MFRRRILFLLLGLFRSGFSSPGNGVSTLFQTFAPALALVLLERVLEGERLVAEVAAERFLGQMTGQVLGLFLQGLRPVGAVRASELAVAVLGVAMAFQLLAAAEAVEADVALVAGSLVVNLTVDSLQQKHGFESGKFQP